MKNTIRSVVSRKGIRVTKRTISNLQNYSAKENALPSFLIIGAMKCGTSSLYHYLSQHPQIVEATKKEVHYFDFNNELGLPWYRSHFPNQQTLKIQNAITGEASPEYMYHPRAAAQCHLLLPKAKIIVMLRDPVERTFSQYSHYKRFGEESLSFEEALEKESERLEGAYENYLLDRYYWNWNYFKYGYQAKSRYFEQLVPWFRLYGESSIMVINSSDFYAHTRKITNKVFNFLNLDEYTLDNYPNMFESKKSSINNETRTKLTNYFREHNENLYQLIGQNFDWQ